MTLAPHPHVVAALAAIQDDFRNPEKLTPQERQRRGLSTGSETGVTYAYRGIEQIEAEVQRLCGQHGVVITPTAVHDVAIREITINNKPWTDSTIRVTWRVMGPGGLPDSFEGESIGWGRDNADKGYNKAFTSARKNFLLALFHIGDRADDTDGETHERDAGTASAPPPAPVDPDRERATATFARMKNATDSVKQAVKDFVGADPAGRKPTIDAMTADLEWRAAIDGLLNRAEAAEQVGATQVQVDAPPPHADDHLAPTGTLPLGAPADQATGPFPASDKDRLADWMRADPKNVDAFHAACTRLGFARAGQRRVVKSLTDPEVEALLTALLPADESF